MVDCHLSNMPLRHFFNTKSELYVCLTMLPRRKFWSNRVVIVLSFVFCILLTYLLLNSHGSIESRDAYFPPNNEVENLNSHLDKTSGLSNFKSHLIKMRSFLSKISNSTSNGSDKSGDTRLSDLQDEDFIEEKHLLESYANTFVEIGRLLERTSIEGVATRHAKMSPPRDRETVSIDQVDKQKQNIKSWDQMYESFDQSESADQTNNLRMLQKLMSDWDPFHITFPTEQMQDRVLINFEMPDYVFEDLNKEMVKMESRRQNFTLPKAIQLDVYPESQRIWKIWHNHITQYEIYNPDDPAFKQVVEEMNESPIEDVYEPSGGTQQKLVFYLDTGLRVIFKPMRFPRKQETLPDHMFWRDYERHIGEIAAFNLDRVLAYHRVPPVVGRYINVTQDVKRLADNDLAKTFFISPAGNICFYGNCQYYCDTAHAVCGRPEILEGSVMAFLPTSTHVPRTSWRHPWRRSYSKHHQKAEWQEDYDYCEGVRNRSPYNSGRRLLDLMDMAVFDFLAGNMDRHHYETFDKFAAHGNMTAPILFDNGRGFGKSKHDELTIMAPLYQCCLMRYSTLQKLLTFQHGPQHLSDLMRDSMAQDKASPILLEGHLKALDRRLGMILLTVDRCVEKKGFANVVKDDGL